MSNNTTAFIVEIVTSKKITDDHDIDEMSQRIANAIVNGDREFSMCPADSDTRTEIVYVRGWYNGKQIIEHV